MTVEQLQEYELLEKREIKDLASTGYLLKHKKSGARLALLSNEDENKVFTIGFRTPPEDSTGLPHILEHSVLCGSKKFPVKDPFVELAKGSLNTFLNAMTYPDKTVYPVASCNEKDFQNLMDVYMDAVFFTNIYEHEEIFRQEGWHYELEEKDAPLVYNGVVYNEMKGAFSSPDGVLDREILASLFPDTAYSNESGGDPDCIPELKYSQFLNFHSKYYHPSNSYIYLYGDMDMAEKLIWLDKEYLSKYDAMPIDSEIGYQKPFEKAVEVKKEYSITSDEPLEDATYLSYNKVIGTSLDKELYLAFTILEYALISAPGAPLRQALLDAKIGKDILGSYDNGTYQPIFSIVAKNANLSDKERFLGVIEDTLKELIKNGLDKKSLKAGINYYEFKYREADFGNYPKGLMFGLQMFDSWLYDEKEPFMHIEFNDTFAFLKEQVETGYYEQLIQKYLLDNTHASVVIIEPKRGLTGENSRKLEEKLAAYKASLSDVELEKLVEDTKALKLYQETPSPKEDLEKIPLLKREDIGKKTQPLYNEEKKIGDIPVLWHDIFTNGIGYLSVYFDAKEVPVHLVPYLGILKAVLGYIDTKNYKYGELYNEINMNTGGIVPAAVNFNSVEQPEEMKVYFGFKTKVLYENTGFAFEMMNEIIKNSRLDDEKRLYEIVAQLKSRLQMQNLTAGHTAAIGRSMSYFSKSAKYADQFGGIGFYEAVKRIEEHFEEEKEALIANLKALMNIVFRRENLFIDYTGENKGYEVLEKEAESIFNSLYTEDYEKNQEELKAEQLNEGFKTSSKVQYVAMTGDFRKAGYSYHGSMQVLKVILGYDYLWNQVRVMGGAYGCMNGYNKIGETYFVSYRDPNLEKTIQVYEGIVKYLEEFDADERDMTKYIIGAISELDTPLNPKAKGARSLTAYMTGQSIESIQKARDEVLNANPLDIRKLADVVRAVLAQNNLCVLGSEEKIEEQKSLFANVKTL